MFFHGKRPSFSRCRQEFLERSHYEWSARGPDRKWWDFGTESVIVDGIVDGIKKPYFNHPWILGYHTQEKADKTMNYGILLRYPLKHQLSIAFTVEQSVSWSPATGCLRQLHNARLAFFLQFVGHLANSFVWATVFFPYETAGVLKSLQ